MKKVKHSYICTSCSIITSKWSGQCLKCYTWDSLVECDETNFLQEQNTKPAKIETLQSDSITSIERRINVPIKEMNQVLGGGIVEGSTILVGGDPGIGKSTLMLQIAIALSKQNIECVYVSGEESANQIQSRAKRLCADKNISTYLIATNNLESLSESLKSLKNVKVIIIDSIQTVSSSSLSSLRGSAAQIRITSQHLIDYAKQNNVAIFFIGHVTKEGQIAGPKILEHMVDTVLYFEGEQNNQFRIIRSIKNRFGSINEIGIFEMKGSGLSEISNPSKIFLSEKTSIPGVSIFMGIKGSRSIPVEIQVLLSSSNLPVPKRTVVGWDLNRLSMIIAILSVRAKINISKYDVYVSVSGGIKISDPAADLAVAAALISAHLNKPINTNSVFLGEISLSGEIRRVDNFTKRLKEIKKIGFQTCICTKKSHDTHDNEVNAISDIIYEVESIKTLRDIL